MVYFDEKSWQESLQKVLAHFADPSTRELMLNGHRAAAIDDGRCLRDVANPFVDGEELIEWVLDLADRSGVHLSARWPMAGGEIPELPGRWHAVVPPASGHQVLLSMRRHRLGELSLDAYSFAPGCRAKIEDLVTRKQPVIIAGPTGAGKTTLMTALLCEYAWHERVILLETIAEIPCLAPRWARLTAQTGQQASGVADVSGLLAQALRLRPDRLVISELRGGEAMTALAALDTGHLGWMTSLHAGCAESALKRFASLAGVNVEDLPRGLGVAVLRRGAPPHVTEVQTLA